MQDRLKVFFLLGIIFISAFSISAYFFSGTYSIVGKNIRDKLLFLSGAENKIPNLVDSVLPSVVTVASEVTVFLPTNGIVQSQEIQANIGSGFIISSDGFVVTNKHVVTDSSADYEIITSEGSNYVVENIYRDPLNDLAILKISAKDLDPIRLGNSDNLRLGETVLAVGTPLGEFANTVTLGIISGLERGISVNNPYQSSIERLDNVIQTDAAISPGNSGGPLINMSGEAVGVNTAVSSIGENLGFALPISLVKEIIDRSGTDSTLLPPPFIGVRYQMVDETSARTANIPEGAYIHEVIEDSPADNIGLTSGDIITSLDGNDVRAENGSTLSDIIRSLSKGSEVEIEYYSNNEIIKSKITIG